MGDGRGTQRSQNSPNQQPRQGGRRTRGGGKPPLRFNHAQVVAQLVDYHFGRLSPEANAAIEAHISTCAQCQREGLAQAPSEQRRTRRALKRVRGGKPLFSSRGRVIILLLGVVALAQLTVLALTQGGDGAALARLFGARGRSGASSAAIASLVRQRQTFSPSALTTFDLALSPDGRTLAAGQAIGAGQNSAQAAITFWDTTTGKMITRVHWPEASAPQTLVWSPDGQTLAAVDGKLLVVWSFAQKTQLWSDVLPIGQAMLVYAAQSGVVLAQPDPTTLFAQSAVAQWGTGGALANAPAGAAGTTGVATLNGPLVSPWHTGGVHLFAAKAIGAAGTPGVMVGDDLTDPTGRGDILSWSPDAQYLVWGRVALSVAVASSSTGTASGNAAATEITPPDVVVESLAQWLLQSAQGVTPAPGVGEPDASLWFSSNATTLAACERSGRESSAPTRLQVSAAGSGNAIAQLTGACDSQPSDALAWTTNGQELYFISRETPITLYHLP